jgi:hypothetical protein
LRESKYLKANNFKEIECNIGQTNFRC